MWPWGHKLISATEMAQTTSELCQNPCSWAVYSTPSHRHEINTYRRTEEFQTWEGWKRAVAIRALEYDGQVWLSLLFRNVFVELKKHLVQGSQAQMSMGAGKVTCWVKSPRESMPKGARDSVVHISHLERAMFPDHYIFSTELKNTTVNAKCSYF